MVQILIEASGAENPQRSVIQCCLNGRDYSILCKRQGINFMRFITSLLAFLMLTGCAAQYQSGVSYPTHREVYVADTATESEIDTFVVGVGENFDVPGDLKFSDVYAVRRINGGSTEMLCGMVGHGAGGESRIQNVHLRSGKPVILAATHHHGACDPTKYTISPTLTMSPEILVASEDRSVSMSADQNVSSEPAPPAEPAELSEEDTAYAQDMISERLKDPESARFRRMYIVGLGGSVSTICGEVNAKNSYGGYTGYKPFLVVTGIDRAYFWDSIDDDSFENTMIRSMCDLD
jgi:hypothetical protein